VIAGSNKPTLRREVAMEWSMRTMIETQERAAGIGLTIFPQYRDKLRSYLLRRLGRPQDVDDLTQEVWVRFLMLDKDKSIEKPLAYLYGIASHVLADFIVKADYERGHLDTEADLDEDTSSEPAMRYSDDMADRLNVEQQVKRALDKLPSMHAQVLLAHKRDGLSYEETATKLKLSIHTVEKYVTQSKAAFRGMVWEM
jgi:RNA polymerase sigma factor (sigma-70 family)